MNTSQMWYQSSINSLVFIAFSIMRFLFRVQLQLKLKLRRSQVHIKQRRTLGLSSVADAVECLESFVSGSWDTT